ncbi:MAG: hypothetical protein GYB49_05200 [Alphaproteobacteria bacterium]|jgi:hypothetical protein|nr:hypothetical protein [Hyphomonas sp.]MBR9806602.1 hypothetical protein [Alphaproteobacteria bacterium]|tara:strand:+ start:8188 stop:9123 length:936 start_codon:yes stop_codon:yes gene_type:complete
MIRGLLFVLSALACFAGGVQSASAQSNEYHWVNVCNRGDVDLHYVVLRTRWNLGQGDRAQLSGWHTIHKGKCEDVNTSVYQGIAIGFTHALMNGGVGNPVYHPQDAQAASGNKRAPAVLCVPQSGAINRKGSLSSVLSAASPPCSSGTYPLRMSFYSKLGEYAPVPKFIIKPRYSAALAAWPEELRAVEKVPEHNEQKSGDVPAWKSVSSGEVMARIRGDNYTAACWDSLVASSFPLMKMDKEKGCVCLADALINGESEETLLSIDMNLRVRGEDIDLTGNKDKDFDTVINTFIPDARMTSYMSNCQQAQH